MNTLFMGHSYEWWSSQFKADFEKGVVYSLNGRYKDKRSVGSVHNITGYMHLFKRGDDGVGMTVKVHRLIYFLYHKTIDEVKVIDHIDRNKLNNSIENLREVNHADNAKNIAEVGSDGNYIGVFCVGDTYEFRLNFDKVRYHKGGFTTSRDAYLARSYLKKVLAGDF